jgi:phytoene desaturase
MGGTGALVSALVRKFEELGGTIRYSSEVVKINVERQAGKPTAEGVTLADGTQLAADVVISNGDYANTYMKLVESKYRRINGDLRIKAMRQSMSLVVIYFGFRADGHEGERLRHHNILLSPGYETLLNDVFNRKVLPQEFSHYLHLPTLTDPSLAPPGHHAAYTLVPVPHNGSGIDWAKVGDAYVDKALRFLDEAGYLPGLCERLVYKNYITPNYFENSLNSWLGNAFGPEPVLTQSAFFRPHNKSEEVNHLYLVGASTQPGGGTPSVMMSAKMTARVIAQDFKIAA